MNKNTHFLYRVFRMILGPIFKLYYNPKIIGKENYEEEKNIDMQNKTELENKIQQYLQKKNLCIERAKSLLIRIRHILLKIK